MLQMLYFGYISRSVNSGEDHFKKTFCNVSAAPIYINAIADEIQFGFDETWPRCCSRNFGTKKFCIELPHLQN